MNIFIRCNRRTKNFLSNYLGGIFSGTIIGVFFALVIVNLAPPNIPDWESSSVKWAIYIFFTLLLMWIFYKLGIGLSPDIKEKQNFHGNFVAGIMTATTALLLIAYNNWIRASLNHWFIALGIAVIAFFPVLYFYLKTFPKSKPNPKKNPTS